MGIGWGIDDLAGGTPLDTVCSWIESCLEPGWGRTAAQIVRRFGAEAKIGDFVWTRDTSGRYLLGRITGDYRYDISDAAKLVDVHQVRDVEWGPRALNDLEAPGGVIRRFIGQGQSFSRIHDESAQGLTPYLWEKLHGRPLPPVSIKQVEVLRSHLDPYDVEDLVYVWLQVERGYLALPRTRQPDTPAYEWTMIHRDSRRRGIVQIKTGAAPVDLQALADARADKNTDTYAFATCGKYVGDASLVTEVIASEALLAFVEAQPDLLPLRVRTMFELAA